MFSPKKEQHNAFYRNLDDNVLTTYDLITYDLQLFLPSKILTEYV